MFFADMAEPGREGAWYQVAFSDLYPILYAHRDDASATTEAAFAIQVLGVKAGSWVVDIGCGGGRHQRALQARGIDVVGIDLSLPLLAEHRLRGGARLVRADMRSLPLADAVFDAATSFFTSFGYFESDDADARVLQGVARVIRPEGRYLLDYLYSPRVADSLVPRTEREVAGYNMVEERRIEDQRVKKRVSITPASGGEVVSYEESVRLYSPDDLEAMLGAAGLRVVGRYGALDGAALGAGHRCVLVAERSL